jgi:hypothetical protein
MNEAEKIKPFCIKESLTGGPPERVTTQQLQHNWHRFVHGCKFANSE